MKLLLSCLFSAVALCLIAAETPKLTRTVTRPFPADFKGFTPKATLDLSGGAIIRAETGSLRGFEDELRKELKKTYGVELPVMSAGDALKAGKTLVLFGENRSNMPLRRLTGASAIESIQKPEFYEARIYPELLDYPAGVVYFGGRSAGKVLAAVRAAAKANPDPAALPFFIEREDLRNHEVDPAAVQKEIEGVKAHLDSDANWIPNQTVIRLFRPTFANFLATGKPEYARAIAAMQQLYLENFQRNIKRFDKSGPAPSFLFHEYVWKLEIVAQSPYFTPEDRARAAELMRQVAENCFDYYEMRAPMKDYAANEQNYHTNHETFCSRSVYFLSEHLLRHYNYAPARYWQAVALNNLGGVADQPIGPEDSAAYQYLNYQIFTEYVIASGKFDLQFFNSEKYQNYIRYCKAQYCHLGVTSGYGDNPPLGNAWSFPALGNALSVFGDPEAESLLALIYRRTPHASFRSMIDAMNIDTTKPLAMSDDLRGLSVFALDDFRLKFNQADGLFKYPVLDKAFFRSGWTPDSDFVVLSGISGAAHGHYDANALIQYLDGEHYWLVDGDYIRRYPENHNTVNVSRNGVSRLANDRAPSRFGQLRFAAMTPDKRSAVTATAVEDLNGVDWTRSLAYYAGHGFWVIDELQAKSPGDYLFDCRFRTLGDKAAEDGQNVRYRQKPSGADDNRTDFLITAANDAVRSLDTDFDTGHSGENGYYQNYKFADKYTRNHLQRIARPLKAGESVLFVNYLQARDRRNGELPRIYQLADRAWMLVDGDVVRLAVLGKWSAPGIEIDAERCFIGPEGVIAQGPKALKLGQYAPALGGKTEFSADATPELAAALREAAKLAGEAKLVKNRAPLVIDVPALTARSIELPGRASAMAAGGGYFAVGTENGRFLLYDQAGKLVFSKDLQAPVRAAAIIESAPGVYRCYTGTEPLVLKESGGAASPFYCFDLAGKELWKREITPIQGRNGTVRTIFAARFPQPTVVIGTENWRYFAFTPDGKELWGKQVYHGATSGCAGDVNGDGIDEIAAAGEYIYGPVLDVKGNVIADKYTTLYAGVSAMADIDGDGRKEPIFGRASHELDIREVKGGSKVAKDSVALGGEPVAIVPLERGGARFAVAATDGTVRIYNGKLEEVVCCRFETPLEALVERDGKLYAFACEGMVYELDFGGRVLRRLKTGFDDAGFNPARLAVAGDVLGAAVGARLYLIEK
ncbi:MAG: hypothetical protein AB7F32_02685 [Victivallaceae bacterium]